jgi:chemotaxis protein CheC
MQFQITGAEAGFLLIVFPLSTVHRLLHRLLPDPTMSGALSPLEHSAVQEVGNILASSFLSELGDLLGRRILPSPPRIQFEDTAELIRELTRNLQKAGSEIVVVQADFEDPAAHIEGRFFVFPEMASVERLTRSAER